MNQLVQLDNLQRELGQIEAAQERLSRQQEYLASKIEGLYDRAEDRLRNTNDLSSDQSVEDLKIIPLGRAIDLLEDKNRVDIWNRWREENDIPPGNKFLLIKTGPFNAPDLNLRDLNVKQDFIYLSDANLSGLDCSGSHFDEMLINNSDLSNGDFFDSQIIKGEFNHCILNDANFEGAKLGTQETPVYFDHCDLFDANFNGIDPAKVRFQECLVSPDMVEKYPELFDHADTRHVGYIARHDFDGLSLKSDTWKGETDFRSQAVIVTSDPHEIGVVSGIYRMAENVLGWEAPHRQ
jgi:hypothetical protein